jgi:hypothetical protein
MKMARAQMDFRYLVDVEHLQNWVIPLLRFHDLSSNGVIATCSTINRSASDTEMEMLYRNLCSIG